MTKKKGFIVTIEFDVLRRIANYYEFPLAVFLWSPKNIKRQLKGTRRNSRRETMLKYKNRFTQLFDEFLDRL